MKPNTAKLLLWLYQAETGTQPKVATRLINTETLKIIFPEMNTASLRSLLFFLKRQKLIRLIEVGQRKQLMITDSGRQALETCFPALKISSLSIKQWWLVIFLEPPKTDANFRYLRRFLLDKKAVNLTRAIYLIAEQLDIDTEHLLKTIYQGKVMACKTDTFLFSDIEDLIGSKICLSDNLNIISGISKEIDGLITEISNTNRLTDQQKRQFCSIFDRICAVTEQSSGLEQHFFPQEDNLKKCLFKLQQIKFL